MLLIYKHEAQGRSLTAKLFINVTTFCVLVS